MFTISESNRGIKIGWIFLIITIGSFLNALNEASQINSNSGNAYDMGMVIGSKLGLITLLGIGMLLYSRTKKRKFKKHVWGPRIFDYLLVFILVINFIFPLLSGRWVDGTLDDSMSFFYVSSSLIAYLYALLAKPKLSLSKNNQS